MTSVINIGGLKIKYENGILTIEGLEKTASGQRNKETEINKSGNIKGGVEGNIIVKGDNVTLVIEGDVEGNILGAGTVEVKGDVEGNILGAGIIKK